MVTFNLNHIERTYGITEEDVKIIFARQDYCCAICERFGDSLEPVIDHQHHEHRKKARPSDVRGILCHSCNKGLGFFRDNPGYMKYAIDYILDFEEKGFPWDETGHCLICKSTNDLLYSDKTINDGDWLGEMCQHCIKGLIFFKRNQYYLRRAIAYIYYYDNAPLGAFWRSEHSFPTFDKVVPYDFLHGDWRKVKYLSGRIEVIARQYSPH